MADEYTQGRDFISSAKVSYLHHVLRQSNGYLIHPSIGQLKQPCRIADLGTQTGAWALDAAEETALHAQVDGFDISDKFFPPAGWMPGNIHFHIQDVYKPYAAELHDQFDVVNIRLFLSQSKEQVMAIAHNAATLLKPGGCIQWAEHDKENIRPISSSANTSLTHINEFIKMQQEPFPGYDARWVFEIGPALGAAGLEVIAEDRSGVRKSMLAQLNDLHLLAFMDAPRGLSPALDEFRDKHLEGMAKEYAQGAATVDSFITIVARKPVASKNRQMLVSCGWKTQEGEADRRHSNRASSVVNTVN